ncbi:DUF4270 domain-containing protein [Chryseobacterium phosphatilyticum]|uniref:DUF4270 domain-containing protein n=1 Tax=Chryseobacterium phosphatilyticum TaxID=475075 RepID=A0A316X130_9FLAO|nr:DUF4270 family protein [Chryseobacterium phosphatilyticum]PWN64948.1 DUF4270 domain-containing protein [Chryseobacterium phosphatilyticum]
MTHTLKRTFAMLLLAIFGSTILYNCEPDPDSLGEQLFNNDAANGAEVSYPVIAYNVNNNDSIRSDASKLINSLNTTGGGISVGVLGAFKESQFGMQRASYVTQFRMPTDNFDFNGPNAKVDSVVLVLRTPANTADDTYYISDSIKAPGAYDKNDFPVGDEKVAVSIEKKSYPVRKYGNYKTIKSMKINVHEITTFLDTNTESLTRSNLSVGLGELLGSGTFDGNVSTVTVTKKSDNTNVFTGNLGYRIKLDNTAFFQNRIIAKKGKPELQDASNFVRYIKGLRISTENNDGYLFQFAPDDMELIMYYKYDVTNNGVVTHPQTTLKFSMGSPNAHVGQYEYDRTGSSVSTALSSSDPVGGDAKLYVQGMGGPSINVKIPDERIADLKASFAKDKIGIVGARIRVYVDPQPQSWTNLANPITGDRKFTLVPMITKDGKIDLTQFTSDALNGFNVYTYNKSPEYYDFVITKTLKNIIEGTGSDDDKVNKPFLINLGAFVRNASGTAVGAKYTSRAFDMSRAVLTGTTKDANPNKIQLTVTYAKKK